MHYSLSSSKTAFLAEIVVFNGTIQETIGIKAIPDYRGFLQIVNSESAIPINKAAILGFAELFFAVARVERYNPDPIHGALDVYVKDTEYLISIGVQKVHQAFTLRQLFLEWLETTRGLIGYMGIEMTAWH